MRKVWVGRVDNSIACDFSRSVGRLSQDEHGKWIVIRIAIVGLNVDGDAGALRRCCQIVLCQRLLVSCLAGRIIVGDGDGNRSNLTNCAPAGTVN